MRKRILLLVCLLGILSLAACGAGKPESLVISLPEKVIYVAGTEALDLTGGKVAVKYSKGSVKDEVALDDKAVDIHSYSLDVAGEVSVKITYKGLDGVFKVTVIPSENGDYIEVATASLPYKTTYGFTAKPQNVETRGGVLNVYLKDGTSKQIALNDPAVTVREINFQTLKITVLYHGMLADYPFTVDEDEIGFLTVVQMPDRVKYPNSDKIKTTDIDLTGGSFSVDVNDVDYGTVLMEGNVNIKNIDRVKQYVTYEYNASSSVGYNCTVTGRFDISVVNVWPESIKLKPADLPAKLSYDATMGKQDIDLSGGKLTIVDNNKVETDTISLPDARVSVEYALDPDDYNKGIVTLSYKDDIVNPSKLTCQYSVDINEGTHTAATKFNFCVSQMPAELKWDRIVPFTESQKKFAEEGFNLYVNHISQQADKDAYDDKRDIIVAAVFCLDRMKINKGWDDFDALLNDFLAKRITKSEFLEECGTFNTQFNNFTAKYSSSILSGVVLYETDESPVTVSGEISVMKDKRDIGLTPYFTAIDKAEEVFNQLSSVPEQAWTLTLADYAADIEAAYALIMSSLEAEGVIAALSKVLVSMRWDAMDIIYDYYYDDSIPLINPTTQEVQQEEIINLVLADALSGIIADLIPVMQRLMRSYCFGDYTMFVCDYLDFLPLADVLDNYAYKATPQIFEEIAVEAYLNEEWIGKDAAVGYMSYPVYFMREVAELFYNDHILSNYKEIISENLLDVIKEYGKYLWKWLPTSDDWYGNPFPIGEESFESDFETIAALFATLSYGEQAFMFNYLDVCGSVSDGRAYYTLMAEAYFATRLTPQENDFLMATIGAFVPLAYMVQEGVSAEIAAIYLRRMQTLNSFGDISEDLDDAFTAYFGYMLEDCKNNYQSLSLIDNTMNDIINVLLATNSLWDKYCVDLNSIDGFRFIMNYKELERTLGDWLLLDGKDMEQLDEIKINDMDSIYGQIVTLSNAYDDNYLQYQSDEMFSYLYIMFGLREEHSNYIESQGFSNTMQEFLDLYAELNDTEKLSYFNVAFEVIVSLYKDYLSNAKKMPAAELALVEPLYNAYRDYLIMDTLSDPLDPDYLAIKDSFINAMSKCITEYEKITGGKSEAFNTQLLALYNQMEEAYQQLSA